SVYPPWRANPSRATRHRSLTHDSCNRTDPVATEREVPSDTRRLLNQNQLIPTVATCYSYSFTIAFPRSLRSCFCLAASGIRQRAEIRSGQKGKIPKQGVKGKL